MMTPGLLLHIKREQATGVAAALALHALILYGLWRYQIIPPPTQALTVFVSYINPVAPVKSVRPQPVALKPAPQRQETPRSTPPTAPLAMTNPAPVMTSQQPVTSAAEAVVPPPPVARTVPAATAVSSPAVSGPVTVRETGALPQAILLSGELSVTCTDRTPPAYPRQSLRLGEQGKTVLLVELDELGRVVNVTVKTGSGFSRLDEAAINAVKSWHCSPARRNGVAVRSVALQPFNFTLKGR